MDDLEAIVRVVRECEPYLTAHVSYVYWMQVRHCRETCAVAELDGGLVGWASVLPVVPGTFFLHQLGVARKARRQRLAASLLAYLLDKLKREVVAFELEFTVDAKNGAALELVRQVSESEEMRLRKIPEVVQLLEKDNAEELYVMTPSVASADGVFE
jgi:ribosomal protein S18 acetylase RimI-like enzyme